MAIEADHRIAQGAAAQFLAVASEDRLGPINGEDYTTAILTCHRHRMAGLESVCLLFLSRHLIALDEPEPAGVILGHLQGLAHPPEGVDRAVEQLHRHSDYQDALALGADLDSEALLDYVLDHLDAGHQERPSASTT
jgi:hypothetical protein